MVDCLQNGMKRSLHVVDFEHLKMENAMLMNKIEVRGKQLLEAQQQSQAAVHVRFTLILNIRLVHGSRVVLYQC